MRRNASRLLAAWLRASVSLGIRKSEKVRNKLSNCKIYEETYLILSLRIILKTIFLEAQESLETKSS